ncbi:MAG TPA: L-rhamnose isomerase [Aggregatilinea sp.]|nr:L-rhamnose isomerase [Aggregatilinea sp.]HML21897.1 L-rhamnose isomerase [Aggregatilinea sp.]
MVDMLKYYEALADQIAARGIDLGAVKQKLHDQKIELPSWSFGNAGTRFQVFSWPGAARDIHERVADAAFVNNLTGVAPSIAIHIPWDKTEDYSALKQEAETQGISIGAVNPNWFQEPQYKLGSLCSPDAGAREEAIAHGVECIEVMKAVDGSLLSVWLADGTNYAGQDDMRSRKHRLEHGLAELYKEIPDGKRMLVEYKFFEPAFYSTDLPDWGTSYAMCLKLGPKAEVLVDTGHHAQGTNIAQIVMFLLDEGRLGGFHFNSRKYADDDLIVGTVNPLELFEIFYELVRGEDKAANVAYMLDQNYNIEAKIEGAIISVINCQTAYAKALLVNRAKLAEAQAAGDVLGAHRLMMEAYETDVRPLLAKIREEKGIDPDPLAALKASGYEKKIADARGSSGSGWA